MKQAFEKVAQTYETVKKTVKEKWENFKNKFEGTKSEASQEIMKAESPDDLIASGKKLQEKGEALKIEKDGVEKEELQGKGLEEEKSGMIEDAHEEALEENKMRDKEKMDNLHKEALEENKAFDEAKVAKKSEEEAERRRLQAEEDAKKTAEDAKKAEELLAKIKSGNLGETIKKPQENIGSSMTENKEETKNPEDIQYEFYKGTLEYKENGELNSIFTILRDNPKVMLEAYKKNPKNRIWVSKRLSKDPAFVKQMEAAGARVENGVLEGNYDEADVNEKPTQKGFEKARTEAVAFNLARGTRSLEEMGVDKDTARAAIKDEVMKSLDFFGNGSHTFDNQEQIKKAMEAIGGNPDEIINDPKIRKEIVEHEIPRMCSQIGRDRTSFKWMDGLLYNLSKTFKVTKSEWVQATRNEWGGSNVRDYLTSQESSIRI